MDRDDIEWLMQTAEADDFMIPRPAEEDAPEGFQAASVFEITDDELPSAGDEDEKPLWQRGVRDVERGVVEAPTQILGGFRDAGQALLDLGTALEEAVPLGGPQLFSKDWECDPKWLSIKEILYNAPELPDVAEAESNTGAGVRVIAQFVGPFLKVNQALKAGGVLAGSGKLHRVGALWRPAPSLTSACLMVMISACRICFVSGQACAIRSLNTQARTRMTLSLKEG